MLEEYSATTRYERVPQELKDLDQWVCAFNDSKAPMKAFEPGGASSTDPHTWSFFEQAEWAVSAGHYDHIGFVFANNGIVGIDIDCGYDDGLMTPLCCDIVDRCQSYTEKSKSGRGVHILLKGDLPFDGKNNLRGVEIYRAKRFFIITGNVVLFDTIEENQDAIDYVVQTYFSDITECRDSTDKDRGQRIYRPRYKRPSKGHISTEPIYPPITEGTRNLSLASLAGMMHSTGYRGITILEELRKVNKLACDKPLPDRELRTIAESISRYSR